MDAISLCATAVGAGAHLYPAWERHGFSRIWRWEPTCDPAGRRGGRQSVVPVDKQRLDTCQRRHGSYAFDAARRRVGERDPAGTAPDPPPPEPPPPEPPPVETRTGVVIANVLNVRSGPGTHNPVVAQLRYNTQVQIFEESVAAGAVWYRIGTDRWVHSGWVRLTGETPPDKPPGATRDAASSLRTF